MRSARSSAGSSSTISTLVWPAGASGAGRGTASEGAARASADGLAVRPRSLITTASLCSPCSPSDRVLLIERDVELEDVDRRLAEDAQVPADRVLLDQR